MMCIYCISRKSSEKKDKTQEKIIQKFNEHYNPFGYKAQWNSEYLRLQRDIKSGIIRNSNYKIGLDIVKDLNRFTSIFNDELITEQPTIPGIIIN